MTTRPFIPCTNVAQLSARYLQAGQPVENVFNFLGGAAWTTTTLTALATAFAGVETTNLSPLRHTGCTLLSIHVRDLTTQNGLTIDQTQAISGSNVGVALPNNVTYAVKMSTGLAGRSFRGRTYWLGLNQNYIDSTKQAVTTSAQTAIVGALNVLISTTWPNTAKLVVLSLRSGNAWRAAGVATPVLTFTTTDLFVDSQRRRLPSHNIHH